MDKVLKPASPLCTVILRKLLSPSEEAGIPRAVNAFSLYFSHFYLLSSVQFSAVPQSCLTLRDPMDCSTPGFPVHHQLSELAQTQIHRVGDAIQPSHPLSSLFLTP